jgi:hypothetical protein
MKLGIENEEEQDDLISLKQTTYSNYQTQRIDSISSNKFSLLNPFLNNMVLATTRQILQNPQTQIGNY